MEGKLESIEVEKPLFFQQYNAALRQWVKCLSAKANTADAIVAISRKGPRLLELLVKYGYLEPYILDKVVVEFAVGHEPYSQIVLTDDSLIHGSTYLRVRDIIKQSNPEIEICDAPFAIGKSSFPQARDQVDCFGMTMCEEELDRYIIHLSQAFHTLGKPLLTAQPIIEMDLDRFSVEKIKSAIENFAKSVQGECHSVIRPVAMVEKNESSCVNFYSWHVSVPNIVEESFDFNDLATLKFYLDEQDQKQTLRIVPCLQLSFSLSRDSAGKTDWERNILDRMAEPLRDFCDSAVPNFSKEDSACREGTKNPLRNLFAKAYIDPKDDGYPYSEVPPFVLQHLGTLHNYVASFHLFANYRECLLQAFGKGEKEPKELFRLPKYDLQLLVGSAKAEEFLPKLSKFLNGKEHKVSFVETPLKTIEAESFPENCVGLFAEHLAEQKILLNKKYPLENLVAAEEDKAIVEKKVAMAFELYFQRQHYDIEILSRRASTTYRLFFGNNYETLEKIVLDLAQVEKQNPHYEDACQVVRDRFERNIDLVTIVPFYYSHCQKYSPPIQRRLWILGRLGISDSSETRRYEIVHCLTKMFRVGEGVPVYVRKYYARNLFLDVFSQYFRPQNYSTENRDLFCRAYMRLPFVKALVKQFSFLSFFNEIISSTGLSDECSDGKNSDRAKDIADFMEEIPLLIATYQEQLSICTSDMIDRLKALTLEMKRFVDESPHDRWNKGDEDGFIKDFAKRFTS